MQSCVNAAGENIQYCFVYSERQEGKPGMYALNVSFETDELLVGVFRRHRR